MRGNRYMTREKDNWHGRRGSFFNLGTGFPEKGVCLSQWMHHCDELETDLENVILLFLYDCGSFTQSVHDCCSNVPLVFDAFHKYNVHGPLV